MFPNIDLPQLTSLVVRELKSRKGNQRLNLSDLENGDQLLLELAKKKSGSGGFDMSDQRWHGGGISSVAHDTTLTGEGTIQSPLGITDGSSPREVTYVVASSGGDFTDLQSAIDALGSSGGKIAVRRGTYNISSAITISSSNITIEGEGMNNTIFVQSNTAANGITISGDGLRYIRLSGFKLQGPNSGTGIGLVMNKTATTALASIDVSQVYIRQFGSHGLTTNDLITSNLTDIRIDNCGGHGFYFTLGTSITVMSCYANTCGKKGFYLDTTSYSTLIACAADGCGLGYEIKSGSTVGLYNCGAEGIIAQNSEDGTSFKVNGGSAHILSGCYNVTNNAVAYWVTGSATNATLLAVKENTAGGSATAGLKVDSGCTATVINTKTVTADSLASNTTSIVSGNTYAVPGNTGTGSMIVGRAATTNFANIIVNTAGTDEWSLGLRNDSTNDFHFRDNINSVSALKITQGATPVITVGGVLTLAENTSIALDPAGSADGKYTGITVTGTAGTTLAFGDLIYLAVADSRWELTDADASATAGPVMMGMCVLAAAADGSPTNILLQGIIRADAKFPALTVGAPVYVGESPGTIQVAIPTGADNVIRVAGFALTADELYFNPSQDHQITVA